MALSRRRQPRRVQIQAGPVEARGRAAPGRADIVLVDRSSRWGCPYVVVRDGARWSVVHGRTRRPVGPAFEDRRDAAAHASALFSGFVRRQPELVRAIKRDLAGRDLACVCSRDWPCHGDVLLAIANSR